MLWTPPSLGVGPPAGEADTEPPSQEFSMMTGQASWRPFSPASLLQASLPFCRMGT